MLRDINENFVPSSVFDPSEVLAKIEGHLSRIATALEIIASSSGLHNLESDDYLREQSDLPVEAYDLSSQVLVGDIARVCKSHDVWEKDTIVKIVRVLEDEVWACAEVNGTYYEDIINSDFLEKVNGQA